MIAFVRDLHEGIDGADAGRFNRQFADDVLRGSAFGAVVDSYETHAVIYCPFRALLHLPTWADRRRTFERVAASLRRAGGSPGTPLPSTTRSPRGSTASTRNLFRTRSGTRWATTGSTSSSTKHAIFQGYYFFHHLGLDRDMREQFRGHEWFDHTAEFCEDFDQAAFDPGYDTLPLEHFDPLVRQIMSAPKRSIYTTWFVSPPRRLLRTCLKCSEPGWRPRCLHTGWQRSLVMGWQRSMGMSVLRLTSPRRVHREMTQAWEAPRRC